MRRIVSVWLPQWPIERLERQAAGVSSPAEPSPGAAWALVAAGRHGLTLTAASARALAEGVRPGVPLADARAALPALASRAAEPAADRRALLRLARWCGRYGPARNIAIGPPPGGRDDDVMRDHGLWIDVTGVAHLYGGEAGLLDDLCRRLAAGGLTLRAGIADTYGGAYALARFAQSSGKPTENVRRMWASAPSGDTRAAVAQLPVAALRLPEATVVTLRRLGLDRIGALYGLPRAALERRFRDGAAAGRVLQRLDQMLGLAAEPLRPLAEPPCLEVRRLYPAPLISSEAMMAECGALVAALCRRLDERALGARRVRVTLYRADGTAAEALAASSAPVADEAHLMRLLAGRLEAVDAGFGIDVVAAEALMTERLVARTAPLAGGAGDGPGGDASRMIDRLASRIGAARVHLLVPRASHIPERAEAHRPALAAWTAVRGPPSDAAFAEAAPRATVPRPALLLARPEPIAVMAEVPDGAPLVFTWRRVVRRVVRAEGPERIAPEWWRALRRPSPRRDEAAAGEVAAEADVAPPPPAARTRDYYRLEDAAGGAYWVFRAGLYGDEAGATAPAWFLHGLYA